MEARTRPYKTVRLKPHPSTKGTSPAAVSVEYRQTGAALFVRFRTEEDNDGIVWPKVVASQRKDDLWRTTCFEVFVATDNGYVEFNLSPSSEWASYRFASYRQDMRPAAEHAFSNGIRFQAYDATLDAQLDLPEGAKQLAFSAVIQTSDGAISYWAINHPSDKPDFHHPDSFVLDFP